ncbi:MAG: DUF58 domain-containing protein [gamma proteobacterium symbiont of Lucinoma myriamae]|nr:DUF58 domain-containing protein [gamma proteobacterium symbiont of Lucinoma myriamae]
MFSNDILNRPLLSDVEVKELLDAAPAIEQNNTRQVSQRARMGEQIASVIGSGSDFAEVRAYHSGDDPRYLDSRATARSQVPLVRTYHSEFSQPVCLLIDRRASMRFATRVRLKVTQALRMAHWLGGREARSGCEISLVILDSPCHWVPAQQGIHALKIRANLANTPCPPLATDSDGPDSNTLEWGKILSGLQQHVAKGSELILLTDWYGLKDSDSKMLRILGQHCTVRAIHISDPSEVSPAFSGSLKLHWAVKNAICQRLKRMYQHS